MSPTRCRVAQHSDRQKRYPGRKKAGWNWTHREYHGRGKVKPRKSAQDNPRPQKGTGGENPWRSAFLPGRASGLHQSLESAAVVATKPFFQYLLHICHPRAQKEDCHGEHDIIYSVFFGISENTELSFCQREYLLFETRRI